MQDGVYLKATQPALSCSRHRVMRVFLELTASPINPPGGGGVQSDPGVLTRGGGGGHSTFMWTGGAAGGRKPDPVAMRSVHKKYTLSQYTLLKMFICIPCRNIAPSAGA